MKNNSNPSICFESELAHFKKIWNPAYKYTYNLVLSLAEHVMAVFIFKTQFVFIRPALDLVCWDFLAIDM